MPDALTQPSELTSRRFSRRLFALVAVALAALDQFSKYLVVTRLALGDSVPVFGPVLSFTYSRNTSTAMGLVPLGSKTLAVIAGVFIIGILIWGRRWAGRNGWLAWGLALLLGGALGNLIDRVRLGFVVDFLDVHFWPVFNVADIAVVTGAIMILIGTLLCSEPQPAPCADTGKEEQA